MAKTINVTIWNEYRHEKSDENVAKLYPNGLHAAIGEFLSKNDDMKITLAALDDPDQGLPDEVLNNTDVLLWWGHMNHGEVKDDLVERIRQRVYVGGMGFITPQRASFQALPRNRRHHGQPSLGRQSEGDHLEHHAVSSDRGRYPVSFRASRRGALRRALPDSAARRTYLRGMV